MTSLRGGAGSTPCAGGPRRRIASEGPRRYHSPCRRRGVVPRAANSLTERPLACGSLRRFACIYWRAHVVLNLPVAFRSRSRRSRCSSAACASFPDQPAVDVRRPRATWAEFAETSAASPARSARRRWRRATASPCSRRTCPRCSPRTSRCRCVRRRRWSRSTRGSRRPRSRYILDHSRREGRARRSGARAAARRGRRPLRGATALVNVEDPVAGVARRAARRARPTRSSSPARQCCCATRRRRRRGARDLDQLHHGHHRPPKGVMYTHRGAYLNALGEVDRARARRATSVFLWTLPMFHCNGWCFPWAVTAARRHARAAAQGRSGRGRRADPRARASPTSTARRRCC